MCGGERQKLISKRRYIAKRAVGKHHRSAKSLILGAAAFAVVGVATIVAAITGLSSFAASDVPELGIPVHTRNVVPTGEDGVYTITYTVEGKANPSVVHLGGDVIIAYDVSGSMGAYVQPTKDALVAMAQQAIADPNGTLDVAQQNRVAFMSMAGDNDAQIMQSSNGTPWFTDVNDLTSKVASFNPSDGNGDKMGATIQEIAHIATSDKRSSATKDVIIVTDGGSTDEWNVAQNSIVTMGQQGWRFHLIGKTSPTEGILGNVAAFMTQEGISVESLAGTASISSVFDKIGAEIATAWRLNSPMITDTFSEYVEPVDVNDIDVTITERDIASMDPGEDTTGADASPKVDEIKASWDAVTRQLKIAWPDNSDVGARVQYTVSLKIKLTDAATKAYEDNGYAYPTSDVGEAGTGSQSAGKPGFPVSATADGGVLNYYFSRDGVRATDQMTTPYDLPVVQIGRLEADVTYDPNTGDGSIAATTGEHGQTVTLSDGSGFSKLGYVISGWNTNADGSGDAYDLSGDFKLVDKTDVLYAQWSPITYAVRFHGNHDGVTGEMADQQMTYDVASNLTANAYALTGYSFVGWALDGDADATDDADVTDDSSNDENVTDDNASDTTDDGASDDETQDGIMPISDVDTLAENDAVADGADDVDTVDDINGDDDVTDDTAASDDGSNDNTNADDMSTADVDVDFVDQEEVINLTTENGGVIDLYAVWSPNEATIHYIANIDGIIAPDDAATRGGDATDADAANTDDADNAASEAASTSSAENADASQSADDTELDEAIYGSTPDTIGKTDETVQLSENGFKNPNYHFVEWNSAADGSGTSYQPGADWKLAAGTVNLYAIWSNDPAVIVYDKNSDSATGEMANTDGYIDMEATISDNGFENSGYEFIGWNTESDGGGTAYDEGEAIVLTEPSITLYAQWEKIPVIVQMGATNGAVVMFAIASATLAALGTIAYVVSKRK